MDLYGLATSQISMEDHREMVSHCLGPLAEMPLGDIIVLVDITYESVESIPEQNSA